MTKIINFILLQSAIFSQNIDDLQFIRCLFPTGLRVLRTGNLAQDPALEENNLTF